MIQVTRTHFPLFEDYTAYLETIWQAGQITHNGTLCRQLAEEVANFIGVSNLELVTNSTLAIQLAIKALRMQGEIITVPLSYIATTGASRLN